MAATMTEGVAGLLADPGWFLHGVSSNLERFEFIRVSREVLARAPFLDHRLESAAGERRSVPVAEVRESGARPGPSPHFLFHSAFCCSTLLARCLDVPGTNLALREPAVLMDLANARRISGADGSQRRAQALSLSLALLARPFVGAEQTLLKPTNIANNIAADMMKAAPGARALLLYSDLRGFLVSIIKKGEPGRSFGRHLFNIFSLDHPMLAGLDRRQAMVFSDLQIAALVWLAQRDYFVDLLQAFPDRTRSLHCDDFLDRPAEVLGAVSRFLGLELADGTVAAIASGPLFDRDAKSEARDYDAGVRRRERARIEEVYSESLDNALQFAARFNSGKTVPDRLPASLLTA